LKNLYINIDIKVTFVSIVIKLGIVCIIIHNTPLFKIGIVRKVIKGKLYKKNSEDYLFCTFL